MIAQVSDIPSTQQQPSLSYCPISRTAPTRKRSAREAALIGTDTTMTTRKAQSSVNDGSKPVFITDDAECEQSSQQMILSKDDAPVLLFPKQAVKKHFGERCEQQAPRIKQTVDRFVSEFGAASALDLFKTEGESIRNNEGVVSHAGFLASILVSTLRSPELSEVETTLDILLGMKLFVPEHQAAIRDVWFDCDHSDICENIVQAMKNHPESLLLQGKCCSLITQFTFSSPSHATLFVQHGAFSHVAKAMKAFSKNSLVQRHGCSSLNSLWIFCDRVQSSSSCQMIKSAEYSCAEAMVHAVENHSQDEMIARISCIFLEKLTKASPDIFSRQQDQQLLSIIVKALLSAKSNHISNRVIQQYSMRCLQYLVKMSPESRELVLSLGRSLMRTVTEKKRESPEPSLQDQQQDQKRRHL